MHLQWIALKKRPLKSDGYTMISPKRTTMLSVNHTAPEAYRRIRTILVVLTMAYAFGCGSPNDAPTTDNTDNNAARLEDMTAPVLRRHLADGRLTAEAVTRYFLERIAALDDAGPRLNAILETNPDAITIARALDRTFAESGPVGPLHGMPVVLKDNIDTGDAMATTAGSIALAGHHAAEDAFLTARLRDAGAVILAKANLSEWANFRGEKSTSGWSSLGGQTRNPYVLDRNPCGSSSGSAVAVAAGLAPLAVGTETDGSIVCPSGANGIVGIKPTVGTVSRSGIIPISHTMDTAGPMASTVTGAALLLQALVGYDERDSGARVFPAPVNFAPAAEAVDLAGIRIGVLRNYYGAGTYPKVEDILTASIGVLEGAGATIVDPLEIVIDGDLDAAEFNVMKYEFKTGVAAYLKVHCNPNGMSTLTNLIAFNTANAVTVMPIFGQEVFEASETMGELDNPTYQSALEGSVHRLRRDFDKLFAEYELTALIAPVNAPAWKTDWVSGDRFMLGSSSLAAITGYPSVVVPAGYISDLPVNLAFMGPAFSEAKLIQLAYVFEQATRVRKSPRFLPTLEEIR